MFGAKAKKAAITNRVASTSTITAVSQKIDELQTTLEQEQKASAGPLAAEVRGAFQNLIGQGTVIEGNVLADGDLVIDGFVKGDVTTKTKLVTGPTAVIEGNILAQHAEIAGRVQGTVKALGLLVINSSGVILGDVITKDLNVESGSTFNGRLQVGGNVSAAPIEIPKVTVSPLTTPTDTVFEVPQANMASVTDFERAADNELTAEQFAANVAKSVLLH